jgi:hypothetical protein
MSLRTVSFEPLRVASEIENYSTIKPPVRATGWGVSRICVVLGICLGGSAGVGAFFSGSAAGACAGAPVAAPPQQSEQPPQVLQSSQPRRNMPRILSRQEPHPLQSLQVLHVLHVLQLVHPPGATAAGAGAGLAGCWPSAPASQAVVTSKKAAFTIFTSVWGSGGP